MRTLAALTAILVPALAAAPAPAGEAPASGTVVLNAKSFWRCHLTWKTEMIRSEAGTLGPVELGKGKLSRVTGSELPPANWASPDFDDSQWHRTQGPVEGTPALALICLRGKFEVKDPAAAGELTLALAYRGGVVVSLNGREVARGHVPGETSKTDLLAPAEDYPKDAYVDPEGYLLRTGFGDPDKYKDRFALRDRKLNVKLPADALRKGVNVLALEFHRPPTHEAQIKAKCRSDAQYYAKWGRMCFQGASLTAPGGTAVVPNVSRPSGFRVWNHSVMSVVDPAEYADPNEPIGAMRIVGCRNGAFSGQVAAGATEAIKGLKAEASALKGPGGAEISASAVQVRWPRAIRSVQGNDFGIESLEVTPPAEVPAANGAALQPVYLTVNIPKDAKPGDYAGKLSVSAGAAPVEVPVAVKVLDWTLPDTKDFPTHAGLVQSPDSLALQYNVPLWSDAHWKLIDQSFELLAQVGTREVYIPLICETHHGNEQSMVRWIKDGAGYKYDYSIAEKYLDTAIKRLGKINAVALYIWDRQGIGSSWGKSGPVEQKNPARVSLLDPATGKVERLDAPKWGTPESVPFWKPVFEGMRERLKARNLEGAGYLAQVLDAKPLKATVEDLGAAAPGMKWMMVAHLGWTGPLGSWASVWSALQLADPDARPVYQVKNPGYFLRAFCRDGGGSVAVHGAPSTKWRVLMESEYCAGNDGFGWVGADFWPCRKDPKGRPVHILGGQEVGSISVPLEDSCTAVLAPGAAGPISTLRFEMLRENTQETQAALLLSGAVNDPAQRAKLGDDLAKRIQDLLYSRGINLYWGNWFAGAHPENWPARPWQAESEKLYALAGEVAGKLGK
jgi:hypothetical protein